ncbi:MAG: class I SAM-dependent methyltransferase [Candidatus Doudnabacteria bacterium]
MERKRQEQKLRKRMYHYLKRMYEGVLPPHLNIQKLLDTGYNFEEAKKQYQQMARYLPRQKEDKILDAGSGFGYFISYCLKRGLDCYGYETDDELIGISQNLLRHNNQDEQKIQKVNKGYLPFPDSFFDLINVHYVADYVQDRDLFWKELKRVLKDNGAIYCININYMVMYCNIYYLFFIPWLPRIINRWYLKLRRRNPNFFHTLNFITPHSLKKEVKKQGLICTNKSLEEWLALINQNDFCSRSPALVKVIKFLDFFQLRGLLKIIGKMGFYSPMISIIRKDQQYN